MAAEDRDRLARRRVPNPRRLVRRGRDDPRAVRRERGAPDRVAMAAEDRDRLAVATSQTRAVLSYEAVTTRAPSGEKAALWTRPSWPLRTAIALPVAASQTRAVIVLKTP